jgi:iron complex outermembrane receptor protein
VAPPLDVYEPVYGAAVPELFYYLDTVQPSWLVGVYAQDHVKVSNRLVATLSARHDWTHLETRDNLASKVTEQSPDAWSGRVGVTYLSAVGLAPYASYSTSFLPMAGATFDGTPYEPTNGRQYEGGLKFQPRHSNSFLTASYFDITQTNVLVPDPDHQFNSIQQGEIRARGLELEGVGNVGAGLNFTASWSYVDQEVTETTDASALGKRPPLVPKQLFKLSAEYTLSRTALGGLGFLAGVRYVGEAKGDSANAISIPGYMLVDASARYLWKDLELLLTVNNVTDKTYVPVCTSASYCNYGTRRQLIGTVRYHWGSW